MPARRQRRIQYPDPDELAEERDRLIAAFVAESPLANEQTKAALSETLANLIIRQRMLFLREVQNDITADEAKTMPTVAANILKLSQALKTTVAEDEDDELDL